MKKRMLALVLLLAMLVTVLVSCTDGEDGADGRDGRDGEQGEKGETGAAGADGNGIAKIEKTATDGLLDTYTITYTDGTTTTFTVTNGEDGEDGVQGEKGETGAAGADGNGIAKIEKTATDGLLDTYTITYTDGTTTTFTVTNGEDGEDGEKGDKGDTGEAGEKGDTGATIEKVELNADGELVITLTDGTVLDPVAIPENTHEHTGEWLDWGSNDYLRCHERMYYRSCTVCENVQVKQGTVDDHLFEGDWVCVDESALCPDKIFVRFCAYCDDYEYKQDATHVYETTYSYDENSHWLACENCSAISGRGAHTYVDTACTTCGAAGDPYLSGIDMKRHQYNALVRSQESGNGAFYCEDFWVDPTTGGGDALSFAVIERNERIEDTYNCTIIQKWSTMESMYEEVGQAFSNDVKYDLTIIVATDAANCATAGYLSNLKNDFNRQYIDLSNEAFDQNSIEEMSMGDALYYLSGDMNISTMDNTFATVFNTDMYWEIADAMVETFEDDDFASPYTMVSTGKWTVQNMLKIAYENTYDANDADGDLSYDKGDTIGYYQYQSSALYYYYGAGMRITENAGGYPNFTINSAEAKEVYDTLYDLMNLNLNTWQLNGASADRSRNFNSGSVLFADYLLWDIRKILYPADIDFAYGILPIPTLEENAEYHSVVYFQNWAHLWALPYKRANNQYAAQMMYILAVESAAEDSTMDAYYVRTMYMQVARDDGSRASLDIIRGALVYDIALLYTPQGNGLWGKFDRLLLTIDTATDSEYAIYTSSERMQTAEDEMQATIDTFNKYGAD